MKLPGWRSAWVALALVCSVDTAVAQVRAGGAPASAAHPFQGEVPTETMPWVDNDRLRAEDERQPTDEPVPFRFGESLEVDFGLFDSGAWEDLPNGDRVWRLRVASAEARSISVVFSDYRVPAGAQLFVYNDDRSWVLGAFTDANMADHGQFAIQPVPGDALTLEYRVPANGPFGSLRISRIVHAYRDIYAFAPGASQKSSGGSGPCNINVNCPLGQPWQDEKRSIARVILGGFLCSGALVNNTDNDGRQLFLTANHCFSGSPATWVFQFNYESPTCGGNSGSIDSVSGSQLLARHPSSDFCLVEITNPIPPEYEVHFSGWDRSGGSVTTGTGMHHPSGDIKKICQDRDILTKTTINGVQSWWVKEWEDGVTEGGSSGSPIYDQNQRVIGQLWGGQASCSFLFNDYYGRLDVSWNNGAASHLDPSGSGATFVDGRDAEPPCPDPVVYCTGKVGSHGLVPTVSWTGSNTLSDNDLVLRCFIGVPGKQGVYVYGDDAAAFPFQGGTLCVSPPLQRSLPFQFDAFGRTFQPIQITPMDVGQTRRYQFWFRDLGDPAGFGSGLSNAGEVTFCP